MAPPEGAPAETVGQRISALRKQRGMTQDGLALACGVSRSAVAQWETDRAGQLRDNITRIAMALGASVEHLLHGGHAGPTGDEIAMLRLYRACAPEDRSFLLRTARRLARTENASPAHQRDEAKISSPALAGEEGAQPVTVGKVRASSEAPSPTENQRNVRPAEPKLPPAR
jgi:transcriptional regulator with XRE-family HTH domain